MIIPFAVFEGITKLQASRSYSPAGISSVGDLRIASSHG